MICEDCPYFNRCEYCGVSPLDTDEGVVSCKVVGNSRKYVVVNIPIEFIINGKGNFERVTIKAVSIKKSLWDRLLKR